MEKNISMIDVPMDLGQMRRDVDMGPSAIRYAGIAELLQNLDYNIYDLGDIDVIRTYEKKDPNDGDLRKLKEVVEANEILKNLDTGEIAKGHFPLVLGGDHSIAICTISDVLTHYQTPGLILHDAD